MRIAVTGSTGKLGSAAVERLRADGHEVIGFDVAEAGAPGSTRVDLLDYGQTVDALLGVTARHDGVDALVHLAAIPVNGLVPDVTTFHTNMTVSFNVYWAARRAGIRTLVAASSITAMGFPFDEAPAALPLDEHAVGANNTYALVKVLEERMLQEFVRWDPRLSVTLLRFTNVVGPGEYGSFSRNADPAYRRELLGSYVDSRDGALAIALALAHARPGLEVFNVAAPDSGLSIPSAELAAQWFPGTPVAADLGEFESLMSTRKARSELGFEAAHLWRDEVDPA